jgi:hypothetical protein
MVCIKYIKDHLNMIKNCESLNAGYIACVKTLVVYYQHYFIAQFVKTWYYTSRVIRFFIR